MIIKDILRKIRNLFFKKNELKTKVEREGRYFADLLMDNLDVIKDILRKIWNLFFKKNELKTEVEREGRAFADLSMDYLDISSILMDGPAAYRRFLKENNIENVHLHIYCNPHFYDKKRLIISIRDTENKIRKCGLELDVDPGTGHKDEYFFDCIREIIMERFGHEKV